MRNCINLKLRKLCFLSFLIVCIGFLSDATAQNEAEKLLFKSGFEQGVYIADEERPAPYFKDIKGSDGMDWEHDLEKGIPFVDRFWLNFVNANIPDDAFADLRPDPVNTNNRVLYFENRKDAGKDVTSRTQNELVFNREGNTFSKGFIRYKFFLHDNIKLLKFPRF